MQSKRLVLNWPRKRNMQDGLTCLILLRAEKADLLLVLLDESHSSFLKEHSDILKSEKAIFVQSKVDLRRQDIIIDRQILNVSSLTGEGVPSLVSAIEQKLLPLYDGVAF